MGESVELHLESFFWSGVLSVTAAVRIFLSGGVPAGHIA